jgi:hypothetical protein
MSNGDVLVEIRSMLEAEKPINTRVCNRLMLVVMSDLYTKIADLKSGQAEIASVVAGAEVKRQEILKTIDDKLAVITNNPAIKFGVLVKEHPRLVRNLFLFLVILIIIASNLWFIPHFRMGIMEWLNMPDSLIEFFTSTPVP